MQGSRAWTRTHSAHTHDTRAHAVSFVIRNRCVAVWGAPHGSSPADGAWGLVWGGPGASGMRAPAMHTTKQAGLVTVKRWLACPAPPPAQPPGRTSSQGAGRSVQQSALETHLQHPEGIFSIWAVGDDDPGHVGLAHVKVLELYDRWSGDEGVPPKVLAHHRLHGGEQTDTALCA